MATREKGVQTTPCPTCETDLKMVELTDGGVAAEVCPTCFSEPAPEKASKQSTSREKGTTNTATEEK